MMSFSVSWEYLAESFLCGLRAAQMSRPNEVFFICARMPLDKYTPDKVERLLGWKPKHDFSRFWRRSDEGDVLEQKRRKAVD